MYIKEIELFNFRIYKGLNKIILSPETLKNVIVVSGKNGYGKTTFLMSLVWCLYGKNMQKVDELYQKEISDKGGYNRYIVNSLNRLAQSKGETKFWVSVTFKDVKIPDITCDEIKITRLYDTIASANDRVEVLIDGHQNELIRDLTTEGKQDGEEIFIRDFILPIEVAKFFFFDAEKIVSLAEINSPEQRRLLSKAYTEVLGIKKYEDLKDQLESIQDEYRKKSAKPQDQSELTQVKTDIEKKQFEIDSLKNDINFLSEEKIEKSTLSNDIQRKLIQEGNLMTLEQLNSFKNQESELNSGLEQVQDNLRDLFDIIPFALAGEIMVNVTNQLNNEKDYKKNIFVQNDVADKINRILDDVEQEKKQFPIAIPTEIRNFYEAQISKQIRKHFNINSEKVPSTITMIHDYSEAEILDFNNLTNNIRHSFRERFARINDEYMRKRNQLDSIRRKIRDAEKDAEDEYISNLRRDKERLDLRIMSIEKDINDYYIKIGFIDNDIKTLRQRQDLLRKKIDDSIKYNSKEEKAQEIIKRLKIFIRSFKEEKKKSLEQNILEELETLMHKKGFIHKVIVDINQTGDDVDINLFNERNEKIDKGSLSMGERQMYASALLKALVDESDIEFPVFIDSPMQKFDKNHAENVIKEFYPNVSKQVVLFPLIHKELNELEFKMLLPKVSKSYLIHNFLESSIFIESPPELLFRKYDELYAN